MAKKPAKAKDAAPEAVSPLSAETHERLTQAAQSARENNGSDQFTDEENRHWLVGTENLGNKSHVLIQAKKGQDVREVYLSTSTFTPELVEQAITSIHGALQ